MTLLVKFTACLSLFINITYCKFSSKKEFEYGSSTLVLQDYVCQGNDVIKNMVGISDIQCSYICKRDPECDSFFYHQGDEVCVTCSAYFKDTSELTAYAGTKYYRVRYVWSQWGSWTPCTKTCGGGIKRRTKTCHADSLVPCTHVTDKTEELMCNINDCDPLTGVRTCAELSSMGLDSSANITFNPLGNGTVTMYCDFDQEPGKVLTVLHHNSESTDTLVGWGGCTDLTMYSQSVEYDVGFEIAKEIADISSGCKQFIEWQCYGARLLGCTFWRNRHGNQSTYFTGSPPPGKYCACGETNSCTYPENECNCIHEYVWRKDGGYVTTKNDLPITGYQAGDTDGEKRGRITIGPLICY